MTVGEGIFYPALFVFCVIAVFVLLAVGVPLLLEALEKAQTRREKIEREHDEQLKRVKEKMK